MFWMRNYSSTKTVVIFNIQININSCFGTLKSQGSFLYFPPFKLTSKSLPHKPLSTINCTNGEGKSIVKSIQSANPQPLYLPGSSASSRKYPCQWLISALNIMGRHSLCLPWATINLLGYQHSTRRIYVSLKWGPRNHRKQSVAPTRYKLNNTIKRCLFFKKPSRFMMMMVALCGDICNKTKNRGGSFV